MRLSLRPLGLLLSPFFVVVGPPNVQQEDDIEVSTEKESVEHVQEVKDAELVKQEELTPNDENDDTGVSQEDDKDVTVASKPEVDEKDDMEAEEEPVEDKEADMEKAEVDEKENKATNNEEAGKVIVLWKKRKKVETKSDTDKVELENEPLNLEKNHNEELKAEDDRQERLCSFHLSRRMALAAIGRASSLSPWLASFKPAIFNGPSLLESDVSLTMHDDAVFMIHSNGVFKYDPLRYEEFRVVEAYKTDRVMFSPLLDMLVAKLKNNIWALFLCILGLDIDSSGMKLIKNDANVHGLYDLTEKHVAEIVVWTKDEADYPYFRSPPLKSRPWLGMDGATSDTIEETKPFHASLPAINHVLQTMHSNKSVDIIIMRTTFTHKEFMSPLI
ncbi:hypothetical protein Tco_0410498 [Tanacetum coccineum]